MVGVAGAHSSVSTATQFLRPSPLLSAPPPSTAHLQIRCPWRKHTPTHLSLSGVFSTRASGRSRRGRRAEPEEVSEEDYEDDDGWEDEDEEEEEEGDNEEADELPFDQMRSWLRNRPAGFGEGKTYDASLEDKLMEEIERSRNAQLANINKLKSNAQSNAAAAPKKKVTKVNEVPPGGVRVRIGNLPRKKNVHRDLQLAFKDFSGIINISPAVTGNQKTKDPICKGFAFVDLVSEEVAKRFVKAYSNQTLLFGKVQKRVACLIMDHSSVMSSSEVFSGDGTNSSGQGLANLNEGAFTESDGDGRSMISHEGNSYLILGSGRKKLEARSHLLSSQLMDAETCTGDLDTKALSSGEIPNRQNSDDLPVSHSSSPVETRKKQVPSKRRTERTKSRKALKINVPGSAIRLKTKERTVLTGVFSKYGGKAAPALAKEE